MEMLYLSVVHNLTLLGHNVDYLTQCIQQLNSLYGMELNIFIDFGLNNNSERFQLVNRNVIGMPKLYLRQDAEYYTLKGNYTDRSLTIINLDVRQWEKTLNYLTIWLWQRQHLHVLIIYPKATLLQLQELFAYCWQQGMVYILVLIPELEQLYSYMPYPEISLLTINNIYQYYQRTYALLGNFQGYTINCGIILNGAPRAFIYKDSKKNNDIYAGYMLHMVLAFITHYNGTLRARHVSSLIEAVDSLGNRTIDFLPFIMLSTPKFTGSVVLLLENLFVMAPSGKLLPRYMYVMKPYTWTTWLLWLIMLIYCSGALFLITQHEQNFSSSFLQVLCLCLFLPMGQQQSISFSLRHLIIFIMLTIAGFILTNLYLAQLATSLTSGLYEKQINTFNDLTGTDLMLPIVENELKHFLLYPDANPLLVPRLIATPEQLVDKYRRQLNTSYIHIGYEDRIDFALYQQKFLHIKVFHKLMKIVYQQPFQIPTRYGLGYMELFNWYMRRMFESGIWLKMRADSFAHGIYSGQLHFVNGARYMKVKSNDLRYYYVVGAIWLTGIILAIICFLYEYAMGKRERNESCFKKC